MAANRHTFRCPGCSHAIGVTYRYDRTKADKDRIELNERAWRVEREGSRLYCNCECGERFPLAAEVKVYLWQPWLRPRAEQLSEQSE